MARNTLQILRRLVVVLWMAEALVLMASLIGAQVHRHGLQEIARSSAPSVVAAERIETALYGMEGAALRGTMKTYETRRQEAASALLSAAENITYGESEREPIRKVQLGLGTYEALAYRARSLRERNDPSYPAALQDASAVMDGTLLPAAKELGRVNLEQLEATYESQSTRSSLSRGALVLAAILLLFAFISTQTYITRRTNRILNLPLLAATLFALAWSGWIISLLSIEQHNLKVIKEDAFSSIHSMWQTRATVFAMEAKDSRALLDRTRAVALKAQFDGLADQVLKVPSGMSIEDVASATRGPGRARDVSGYLADGLHNLHFSGERDAAIQAILSYREFLVSHAEIWRLEAAGKHSEALDLATANRPGSEALSFEHLNRSIDHASGISEIEFDRAVSDSFSGLQYFEWKSTGVAFLIAMLSFMGLLQRIAEYR